MRILFLPQAARRRLRRALVIFNWAGTPRQTKRQRADHRIRRPDCPNPPQAGVLSRRRVAPASSCLQASRSMWRSPIECGASDRGADAGMEWHLPQDSVMQKSMKYFATSTMQETFVHHDHAARAPIIDPARASIRNPPACRDNPKAGNRPRARRSARFELAALRESHRQSRRPSRARKSPFGTSTRPVFSTRPANAKTFPCPCSSPCQCRRTTRPPLRRWGAIFRDVFSTLLMSVGCPNNPSMAG